MLLLRPESSTEDGVVHLKEGIHVTAMFFMALTWSHILKTFAFMQGRFSRVSTLNHKENLQEGVAPELISLRWLKLDFQQAVHSTALESSMRISTTLWQL